MNDFQKRLEAVCRRADGADKGVVIAKAITRQFIPEPAKKTYGIWLISVDRTINQQKLFNIPDRSSADRAKKCLKDKKSYGDDGFIEFLGWEVREEITVKEK